MRLGLGLGRGLGVGHRVRSRCGRLLLTAKDTGAANNSTFSDSAGGSLLTSLGLDSSTNAAGVDANITVNGIAESSANNVFTGALSGVDLTASAVGTGTVTIAADPSQVVNGVKDLVAKFNDIVGTINNDIAYNADSKTGGPLTGDSYASNLLSSLTRQITGMFDTSAQASGSLSGLRSYSDVGISVQKDGTLQLWFRKQTVPLMNEWKGYADYTSAFIRTVGRTGYGYYETRIRPMSSILFGIVSELLPPSVPRLQIHLTAFSVIGQCLFYKVQEPVARQLMPPGEFDALTIDQIAQHIAGLMLAALGRTLPRLPAQVQEVHS